MAIKFDLDSLVGVADKIRSVTSTLMDIGQFRWSKHDFSSAPSLEGVFAQHSSFWIGQSGSMDKVVSGLQADAAWLVEAFAAHTSAFDLQESLSSRSFALSQLRGHFDVFGAHREVDEAQLGDVRMPTRNFQPIDNLLYTTPVTAVEASTPLPALIAMFSGDDSAPLAEAKKWESAGHQMESAMAELHMASSDLGAVAHGASFDAARDAIGDVITLGRTVAANAKAMSRSVATLPEIRATNLAALEAIQANTALIPEPAERLAAEQAAVATFVSSHLQPSLELARPPVSNMGIPIVGHYGGDVLHVGGVGQPSCLLYTSPSPRD